MHFLCFIENILKEEIRKLKLWSVSYQLWRYKGYLERNSQLLTKKGGVGYNHSYPEGQSVSNCGIGKVFHCLLIFWVLSKWLIQNKTHLMWSSYCFTSFSGLKNILQKLSIW